MANENDTPSPEKIIVGYLYNLTKFIKWPMNAFNFSMSPFIIGILGSKSYAKALATMLRDKQIRGRDWKVEVYNSPLEIRNCHLVFLSDTNTQHADNLVETFKNRHILTVGDHIANFCEIGGMINLKGNIPNLGFEINTKAVRQAKLEVDPELLDLATVIE